MVAMQLWISKVLGSLKDREEGAAAVEYGLLVALIAVAIIVTVQLLGTQLNDFFSDITTCLANPSAGACGGGTAT
jgi:pilus assembly protein Flp/PilA